MFNDLLNNLISDLKTPVKKRTYTEFSEQEIIIPDGPYAGRKYNPEIQPYARYILDALDSNKYNKFVFIGPVQSGKTLISLIPLLYSLFENQETVIYGLPTIEMATDKFEIDIKPTIYATKYKDLIPSSGRGSKGGRSETIIFENEQTLKFMSAGGNPKKRSGFTSRIVIISEVDGMDITSDGNIEGDKISQIIARSKAYGENNLVILESTVTTPEGRIYREWESGTRSNIYTKCLNCHEYVLPERTNLIIPDYTSEIAVKNSAYIECPNCKYKINDEIRLDMLKDHKLVSTNESDTFSIRWNAFTNTFTSIRQIAYEEYNYKVINKERKDIDKAVSQFLWATPYEQEILVPIDLTVFDDAITKIPQGFVPDDYINVYCGMDCNDKGIHYIVCAYTESENYHIIDYGFESHDKNIASFDDKYRNTYSKINERLTTGYPIYTSKDIIRPVYVLIDSGYRTKLMYSICAEYGIIPIKGYYKRPNQAYYNYGQEICDGISIKPKENVSLLLINTHVTKCDVYNILTNKHLTIYNQESAQHDRFFKSLNSEEYNEKKYRWEVKYEYNHFLDCMCIVQAAHKLALYNKTNQHFENEKGQIINGN